MAVRNRLRPFRWSWGNASPKAYRCKVTKAGAKSNLTSCMLGYGQRCFALRSFRLRCRQGNARLAFWYGALGLRRRFPTHRFVTDSQNAICIDLWTCGKKGRADQLLTFTAP